MFRNASKAGLVGLVLVVGAAGAVGLGACSSSSDSGGSTSTGGTSAHGGTGGASSVAGTTSTGGTNAAAGSTSVAGTSSGAGTTSTGGTGAGGGSATGPFACAATPANCSAWTTFPQSTMNSWGSGMFTGGITVFGTGLTRDATTTDSIHVTGMVTGYGFGFGLYFSGCADLSKYTGISFKVKGTTDATAMLALQVQSNDDTPWQPRPMDMKGACTAPDPTMAYSVCIPSAKSVAVTSAETTVSVVWADLVGGMPKAALDPKQIVGLQWALPWAGTTGTPYAADITVSDVELTGGTGAAVSCAMGAGGTGAGGAGGAPAGGAGGAAAGSGGVGGST